MISYSITEHPQMSPFNVNNFEIYNFDIGTNNNYYKSNEISDKLNLKELIRHSHLNHEEQNSLFKLLQKYRHVLHKTGDKLTFTNEVKHKIKTTDEIPVHAKTYRYPYVHKNEIEKQIAEMLENKIIQPSSSPWSSPVWIVPKKLDASGQRKWRLVIDYRKLNEKTIDDRYPIPNISDILDKLGRAQYFTTLDLASGFHQIEMDPESIQKTAFNVEHGHYEYLRMPFGLKNAPATFQRTMDNVLRGLQGKICLVYMDDIIIFSTSLQEHLESLRKVFDRLTSYNLKIQLDKSEFLKKSVEFLGHVITPEGIKPNPKKVSAIKNFEIPKTPKEIKSFLGLIGFYRKFIKNFAKITKPLTQCLKKNSKVNHDRAFIEAFETCKNILMNDPILQHPDFQKPFILTTDASNFAIGAVLSQGTIGNDLPIAYASRTLSTTECNYSTIEKELLAIVWATKYFRPYLFGRKFSIVTDHKPLQWLFSIKEPNSKLVRWRLKLQEFDFTIHYKKGKQNLNADALSRPPLKHSIEIHPVEIPKPPLTHISEISDRPDVNTEDQYLWLDRVKHFFETQEQIPVFEKPKKINNNNSEYEIWNKNWMNIEYSEKIREIKGNLFEQSTDYSLAHCVAADLRMNKGIACIFKHKYKNQKELLEKKAKEGEILIWPDQKESRNIYYLITKRKSEDKPTYELLWKTLVLMSEHIKENHIRKLAIPRLGCGLDHLDWKKVKSMIEYIFKNISIDILVCNLEEPMISIKEKPKIKIISDIQIRPPYSKSNIQEKSQNSNESNIPENAQDNISESDTIHTSLENPILGAPYVNKSINTFKNQIVFKWTNKIKPYVVKQNLFNEKKRTFIFVNENPTTEEIQNLIISYLPPDTYCLHFPFKELEPLILRVFAETFKNNAYKLTISNTLLEDVTNPDKQKEIIEKYHKTKTSHRGITENIKNIKQTYYWPSLERDVIDYIKTCETCQKSKYERHPYKVIYKPTPIGSKPFEHIYMIYIPYHLKNS
ncbi:uncharacterized protein LOC143201674 [Rhynchophorus ferrugineus]|uniref:uncharacterized protein LOC143201674 n=1 Tax=Rhynchophorus ferrugineus TaxID=354439 RepID=UPI003FCDAECE